MSRLIATVFGIGYLRPAPGTWGAAAALPMAWVLLTLGGPVLLVVALVVGVAAAFWAVPRVTRGGPDKDPSEIVIDEVTGQWIALLPVGIGAAHVGVAPLALWPGWIAAFLLFRLFDVWKPGPIGRAERTPGPWGVISDDLIAGLFAAIGVVILAGVAHGVMGG